jgi:hypothetical protein
VRVLLLALAVGVMLSVGLGVTPFFDFTSDGGRYAAVVRKTVASGGYILPSTA